MHKKAIRRCDFLKGSTAVAAATAVLPQVALGSLASSEKVAPRPLKPKVLPAGSTLALITPGSSISDEQFERALTHVKDLGYRAKYSPRLRLRNGFLAGTDAERLEDLHTAFQDSEVDGVLCVRGGYGTMRLLDKIDYAALRPHVKPLIGFSDITALHLALYKKLRWVSFHGPMGASTFRPFTRAAFKKMLQEGGTNYSLSPYPQPPGSISEGMLDKSWAIVPGKAQGRLMGGNLTMIAALLGTPYAPDFRDCIVFLEEVGERPYRVDRLLTQLLLSGALRRARALVLGIFNDCEEPPKHFDPQHPVYLENVLQERLGNLPIPVLYGLPFGHVEENAVLPIGVRARLDTQKKTLFLQEKPFR